VCATTSMDGRTPATYNWCGQTIPWQVCRTAGQGGAQDLSSAGSGKGRPVNTDRIPFVIAVTVTTIWVVMVGAYFRNIGWDGFLALSPAELAVVMAGAGGPLAALWLFIAILEQRRGVAQLVIRLVEMTAQSRQSVQQAEGQTRALLELQAQAARVQLAETRKLVLQDLASNAATLAERLGVLNRADIDTAWTRFGSGDIHVFVQSFLNFSASHPDISERMAEAVSRDSVARTALSNFVRRYDRMTSSTDDRTLLEILDEGALGRGYRLFLKADDLANIASNQKPRQQNAEASAQPQKAPVGPAAQAKMSEDLFDRDDVEAMRRLADVSDRLDESAQPGPNRT